MIFYLFGFLLLNTPVIEIQNIVPVDEIEEELTAMFLTWNSPFRNLLMDFLAKNIFIETEVTYLY